MAYAKVCKSKWSRSLCVTSLVTHADGDKDPVSCTERLAPETLTTAKLLNNKSCGMQTSPGSLSLVKLEMQLSKMQVEGYQCFGSLTWGLDIDFNNCVPWVPNREAIKKMLRNRYHHCLKLG
jgi:hypothetical protein